MDFHPISEIFPLMQGSAFHDLCMDIKENGLREEIVIHQNKIIDGRNRYRACKEVGVEPRYRAWDGHGDLVKYILSLNLHRRHLDASQKAMVGARAANMRQGERTDLPSKDGKLSQSEAAEMLAVSTSSVERANVVLKHGISELIKAVDEGKIPVNRAYKTARLPAPQQKEEMKRRIQPQTKRKQKNINPEKRGQPYTLGAMQFAQIAESQLSRIRPDHSDGRQALNRVAEWIKNRLREFDEYEKSKTGKDMRLRDV